MEGVELAPRECVIWLDNRHLPEPIGNIPPAEVEACQHAPAEANEAAA